MLGTLRDLTSFLLTQGLATILWVGGLAGVGLLIGVFGSLAWGFALRRGGLAGRRPVAMGIFVVYQVVTVPIALALFGGLVGSAFAVKGLTENRALMREAVDMSFAGMARGLESTSVAPEQRQMVLDFVGGTQAYVFDEIPLALDRVSDDTLRQILDVYDQQWAPQEGIVGVAGREVGRRLLQEMLENRARRGQDLLEPAIELLRENDDGDGQALGPEIGAAVAHFSLQKPLARWAFYSVLSQLLFVVPAVLAVILLPLLLIAAYDRSVGAAA